MKGTTGNVPQDRRGFAINHGLRFTGLITTTKSNYIYYSSRMSDTRRLSSTQESHLEAVDALWAEYGPLLRQRRDMAGGVQWKTIGGHEYLYRYAPDPVTKTKRSTSLGRKSPETEAFYSDFLKTRDRVQGRIAELAQEAETLARMSKTLRLGRVRESIVELLGAVWFDGQADQLLLSGMAALPAYEHRSRETVGILPELPPIEFLVGIDHLDEIIDQVEITLRRADKTYWFDSGRGVFAGDRGPEVMLTTPRMLESLLDEWGAEDEAIGAVMECQLLEPLSTMVMAKSGNVAPVSAVDPRAWLAFNMCRAYYDRSLDLDERDALQELCGRVSGISIRMGLKVPRELAELPFMSPKSDDYGGRRMRI